MSNTNILLLLALILTIFSAFNKVPVWIPVLVILFILGAGQFFN